MKVLYPMVQGVQEEFRHTWEGLINVDQFRWFVRADLLEQVKEAHDELGARHVRAVGMLDDEMRVLTGDPTRWREKDNIRTEPNWQIDTYIIERLVDIGVLPMVTTCFMPEALASGTKTTFETKSNICLPKDWKEWRRLIQSLVRHLESHFGPEIVRQMYFEVWNEPNLKNSFFVGEKEDYYRLYLETVSAIKEIDPLLRVGGPSTARAEWIEEFIQFARSHETEPDYLISHVYNDDSAAKPCSPFDGPTKDSEIGSANFSIGVMRGTRRLLDSIGYKGEMHWNEWGRTWWPTDWNRDSANEAAFIVKTMAEVSGLADQFAYWCLSDIYNQVGYSGSEFCGHYGMMSLHGLKKPSYHAHCLLSRLGTRRVPVRGGSEDGLFGAICTADKPEDVRLLVYSYDKNREPDLRRTESVRVEMPREMRVKRMIVLSENENNIVRLWRDAGAPAYPARDLLKDLRAANVLRESKGYTQTYSEKALSVTFEMPMAGIALMEFESL